MTANEMIPGASVRELRSRAGRDYRIFIWHPPAEQATGKLPVVYLLDGNGTFPIAAAATALQSRRPERTGVGPAIIVGVGYPIASWLDAERRTFDYTPVLPQSRLPPRPDDAPWSATGGADYFLDFLEHELRPGIEREFNVDRDQTSLFGHSFGGLFVLHALFSRPSMFRNYMAASPSIWFAGAQLIEQGTAFTAAKPLHPPRRLLVTVGSLEQSADAERAIGLDGHESWIRRNKMVENASELARALSTADAAALEVTFNEFADENHASVLPAAISRALRFALETR
jgi:predicted alpha/beta superfamily hydrolase